MLSNLIAGKAKYVKDPFSDQIHVEASHGEACRHSDGFWEKCQDKQDRTKKGGSREGKDVLREFWPGTPCNSVSFHAAQCGCSLQPVEMATGIPMLT